MKFKIDDEARVRHFNGFKYADAHRAGKTGVVQEIDEDNDYLVCFNKKDVSWFKEEELLSTDKNPIVLFVQKSPEERKKFMTNIVTQLVSNPIAYDDYLRTYERLEHERRREQEEV